MEAKILTILLYLLIMIFIPLFISLAAKYKNKKRRYGYYIISLIIPSLVAAFKGTTGTDSLMYNNMYDNLVVQRSGQVEVGYMWLNNTFSKLNIPYQLFLFFLYFVMLYLILISLDRYRDSINMYVASFILFSTYYFSSFNIMRQCIAVSICFYAIISYLETKKIKALILILLASLIHITSLLCIVIFFIAQLYKRKSKKAFLIASVIVGSFLLFNKQLIGNIILKVSNNTYYSDYLIKATNNNLGIISYLIELSPIIILLILYFNYFKETKKLFIIYSLLIIGYIISALSSVADTQAARMGLYFTTFNTLILGFCSNKNIRLNGVFTLDKDVISSVILLYYFIMFIYSIIIRNFGEIIPYIPFSTL